MYGYAIVATIVFRFLGVKRCGSVDTLVEALPGCALGSAIRSFTGLTLFFDTSGFA